MKKSTVRTLAVVARQGETVSFVVPKSITLVDPISGARMKVLVQGATEAVDFLPFVFAEVAIREWANSKAAALDDMTKIHAWLEMIGDLKAAKIGHECTITKDAHALLCPVIEKWIVAIAAESPAMATQLLPLVTPVLQAT